MSSDPSFSMDDVFRFLDQQKAEDHSRDNNSKKIMYINEIKSKLLALPDNEFESTVKSIAALLTREPGGELADPTLKPQKSKSKSLEKETKQLLDSVGVALSGSSGQKIEGI